MFEISWVCKASALAANATTICCHILSNAAKIEEFAI
jgi:hypothetical protein